MIAIVPRSELAAQDERTLAEGLAHYYSASPAAYYALTEEGGTEYTSRLRPFHADLVSRVRPGMSVLEVGCGAAHLCRYVEQAGGRYTGVDHGLELLQKNRERYRSAHFLPVGAELHGHFDLVASLYTIEHVVNPLAYLETMWQACTPGGILAVICPDFVDGAGLPPSIFFGTTPRRLRDKVKEMAIGDAIGHLRDLVWSAPRWKARARAGAPGAFWINRKPKILHGADYSVDGDAVHLPRLRDLVSWLEGKGASIIVTSQTMLNVDPATLHHNCYVLARTVAP